MEHLSETFCRRVILLESLDHRSQRDNASCRKRPRLAHVAANHSTKRACPLDVVATAAKQRADGRGQSFRYAKAHGIRMLGYCARLDTKGSRCVKNPGAVRMDWNAVPACQAIDRFHVFEWKHGTSRS